MPDNKPKPSGVVGPNWFRGPADLNAVNPPSHRANTIPICGVCKTGTLVDGVCVRCSAISTLSKSSGPDSKA